MSVANKLVSAALLTASFRLYYGVTSDPSVGGQGTSGTAMANYTINDVGKYELIAEALASVSSGMAELSAEAVPKGLINYLDAQEAKATTGKSGQQPQVEPGTVPSQQRQQTSTSASTLQLSAPAALSRLPNPTPNVLPSTANNPAPLPPKMIKGVLHVFEQTPLNGIPLVAAPQAIRPPGQQLRQHQKLPPLPSFSKQQAEPNLLKPSTAIASPILQAASKQPSPIPDSQQSIDQLLPQNPRGEDPESTTQPQQPQLGTDNQVRQATQTTSQGLPTLRPGQTQQLQGSLQPQPQVSEDSLPYSTCSLRISMGPVYTDHNDWRRRVNCTGVPFEMDGKVGILTAAHCFYWRNKKRMPGFEWTNPQITKESQGRWLRFNGTVDVSCGSDKTVSRTSMWIVTDKYPKFDAVRIHPSFDGYKPGNLDASLGANNVALIVTSVSFADTKSIFPGSIGTLQSPPDLPIAGTICKMASATRNGVGRKITVLRVADTELCDELWPGLPTGNGFCVEPLDNRKPSLVIPDNGGPVFCHAASVKEQVGEMPTANRQWKLQGIGFAIRSKAAPRLGLVAALKHLSDDFIDRTVKT